MAVFAFQEDGVAIRINANDTANNTPYNLAVPAASAGRVTADYAIYNECDSTVSIQLVDPSSTTRFNARGFASNDNAGNVMEFLSNNVIRIAPLSAGILTIDATLVADQTTPTNVWTINGTNSARTSHGTASAVGGRVDSSGNEVGERIVIEPITY